MGTLIGARSAQPGEGEFRVHRLAIGVYDDDGSGKLLRTHRVEIDVDAAARTDVPDLVGVPRGKFVLVNDDDLTYCSVRLDEQSLRTVIERVGDIAEPLPRTLVWSAAWEMTRQAELKARDFVALVLQAREQLRVEAQVREMRSRVDDMVEQRTHSVVLENADLQREVDSLRGELIARGFARAREFSWGQAAAAIHRIYMDVLER